MHPTAKNLVLDYKRICSAVAKDVADTLFFELATFKIKGAVVAQKEASGAIPALPPEARAAVSPILASAFARVSESNLPQATRSILTGYRAEREAQAQEKAQEKEREKGEKDKEKREKDEKGNEGKDEKENGDDASTWKVGDQVITKAVKQKKQFDNMRGEVVRCLTKKIRVKFLEGPEKGNTRDFTFDNVSRAPAEAAEEAPTVGPTVGFDVSATAAAAQNKDSKSIAALLFRDPSLADAI